MDAVASAQQIVGLALAVIALGGAVVGWVRLGRPRWRELRAKVAAALDTIVGRPPVHDSITGEELAPALPGMGVRMAHTEEKIAEQGEQLTRLTEVVTNLAEVTRVQADHEGRITALERASAERTASRAESAAAYAAIAAVSAGADPTSTTPPAPAGD